MYKYFAIFRKNDAEETLQAQENMMDRLNSMFGPWRVVVSSGRLTILDLADKTKRMGAHRFQNGQGAILGYLFEAETCRLGNAAYAQAQGIIQEDDVVKIVSSEASWIRDNYWGSYVAFINSNDSLRVIRGPFSTLHCFYYELPEFHIIFSDVKILNLLKKGNLSLNWDIASQFMWLTDIWSEKTSVENLLSLQHGTQLNIKNQSISTSLFWDPEKYCNDVTEDDTNILIEKVRETTYECVKSWSKVVPGILISLSGGFDSSVIAGCLANIQNKPPTQCVNYFYKSGSYSDERPYARITAKRANFNLIEQEVIPGSGDLRIYHRFSLLPNPYQLNPEWSLSLHTASIMEQHNLTAVLRGMGGDGVFGAYKGNRAAQDYVLRNGFDMGALPVALRSARLSDISIWRALIEMLQVRLGGLGNHNSWMNSSESFWGINSDAIQFIKKRAFIDPWSRGSSKMTPGKSIQLQEIMGNNPYYTVSDEMPFIEFIDPFLSQPLVELCLRIPYYQLQFDGRDRGLARAAFADWLAPVARLRQLKAHGTAAIYEKLSINRRFFAELLLEGVLRKNALVDAEALEQALISPVEMTPAQYVRIVHLAGVEGWARAWH